MSQEQVETQNASGGFVFDVSAWGRLRRFLILGSEGGTYYVNQETLERENCKALLGCLAEDYKRAVDEVVKVSAAGNAPSNSPAIFALALASSCGPSVQRQYALGQLSKVCRIPTHLYEFHRQVRKYRGAGPQLVKAYRRWLLAKDAGQLAFHGIKYASRSVGKDGDRDAWSIRDIIRLSHPKSAVPETDAVLRYLVGGMDQFAIKERTGDETKPYLSGAGVRVVMRRGKDAEVYQARGAELLPKIVEGFEKAKAETDPAAIAKLVREYGLSHEMIPTEAKTSAAVWEALLEKMPPEATLRNLATMTKVGLLAPFSEAAKTVAARLTDRELLKKARLHPLAVLIAARVYAEGRGLRGTATWTPVSTINEALDEAFELCFENVDPTGKRLLLALDTSTSMTSGRIGDKPITPREAEAAMAIITLRAEKDAQVIGYTTEIKSLAITRKTDLRSACQLIANAGCGGTDCSQPIKYAHKNNLTVDAIVSFTDSETNGGVGNFAEQLKAYRAKFNPEAKNIVVAMTGTRSSLNSPSDPRGLDVVGFDTSTPAVISEFIKGE